MCESFLMFRKGKHREKNENRVNQVLGGGGGFRHFKGHAGGKKGGEDALFFSSATLSIKTRELVYMKWGMHDTNVEEHFCRLDPELVLAGLVGGGGGISRASRSVGGRGARGA